MAESEGTTPISEKLTKLRKKRGLTKAQLAEKTGITVQMLYKYENGETVNMTISSLTKLCDALKISPTDLLGYTRISEHAEGDPCEIRVFDKVSGSGPSPFNDDVTEQIFYPSGKIKNLDDVFAVKLCRGFVEPPLADGEDDIVILRKHGKSDRIENDGLYAVTIGEGGLAIGKIEVSTEGMTFREVRPEKTDMSFSWQEVSEGKICIIGKCLETRIIFC